MHVDHPSQVRLLDCGYIDVSLANHGGLLHITRRNAAAPLQWHHTSRSVMLCSSAPASVSDCYLQLPLLV
jgi:hypothetical protein